MKNFRQFITEGSDNMTFYHGTQVQHIESFLKNGVIANKNHDNTETSYLTKDSMVAFEYAGMLGGKSNSNEEPDRIEDDLRVVFRFSIPKDWVEEHAIKDYGDIEREVAFDTSIPPKFIKDYKVGEHYGTDQ